MGTSGSKTANRKRFSTGQDFQSKPCPSLSEGSQESRTFAGELEPPSESDGSHGSVGSNGSIRSRLRGLRKDTTSLRAAAEACVERGEFAQAVDLLERALEVDQAALGQEHDSLAAASLDLARLYAAQGRRERSLFMFQRAMEIAQKHRGPHSPLLAEALAGLGEALRAGGDEAAARAAFKRAGEIGARAQAKARAALGGDGGPAPGPRWGGQRGPAAAPDGPLAARMALARLRLLQVRAPAPRGAAAAAGREGRQGELGRARELYQRALEAASRALEIVERGRAGGRPPPPPGTLFALALHFAARGDAARARPLLELAAGRGGRGDGGGAAGGGALARVAGEAGRAGQLAERACAVRETALGGGHPLLAEALEALALALPDSERPAARAAAQRAVAIRRERLGAEHYATRQSRRTLARLEGRRDSFSPEC
eukprot:tig00000692_g3259.t1